MRSCSIPSILAYEQFLKQEPTQAIGLSPQVQRLIGESAMSYEIDEVVHSLFKSKSQFCPHDRPVVPLPPSMAAIRFNELDTKLEQAMAIFSKRSCSDSYHTKAGETEIDANRSFNDHRPHPETSIPAMRYRAFGQRLRDRYGWDETWFCRPAGTG
ncbi:hypothetical protein V865_000053 [Kwoniella europaea PYCC6329]|uniref:Uncharacterized protein n=1 Tax=Kwoniella europaea PYCC6329 TaxID=1423913 RepID=A0AAX4K6N9_9TREE